MKKKSYFCIILACYVATFLRLSINNNFLVSLIGSLLFGFVIAKRLDYSKERIILSGFFSCFTSFSGFIYFLYEILNQVDFLKFISVILTPRKVSLPAFVFDKIFQFFLTVF